MRAKNILLTGPPAVGKTTLIKKLIQRLSLKMGGFYTEEIRESGKRIGFRIITLDNQKGLLAHLHGQSSCRVGKYKVNLVDIENIAVVALKQALIKSELILIDEIGPMELKSKEFIKILLEVLNSSKKVVATIKLKGNRFIQTIKERPDVNLINITQDNREHIISLLESILTRNE